ncbi:MAG: hypothetical protein JO147_14420 [Actinobacteria bacterium]|nr:hypothetical protein [Actinomycetota bacterium]
MIVDAFISGSQAEAVIRRRIWGVHLVHEHQVIADLVTTDSMPQPEYLVDGIRYDVDWHTVPYLDDDGRVGWDVHVHRATVGAA